MELFANTIQDLHAIAVHFPIGLLVVSAGLSAFLFIRTSPSLQHATWFMLWLGTIGAVVSTITGLISHFPYEELEVHSVINVHLFWSFGATALFIAVTMWRWISRWRKRDVGANPLYLVIVLLGIAALTVSGMTGGDLVYEYGINVRGINPLLEQ